MPEHKNSFKFFQEVQLKSGFSLKFLFKGLKFQELTVKEKLVLRHSMMLDGL